MIKETPKIQKKVHLSKDQIETKIQLVSEKIQKELQGSEKAKKRQNAYQKLASLKKALSNPDLIVDPKEKLMKAKKDRKRRIKKKIEKKKALISDKIKERQKMRKVNCLLCKKYGHSLKDCKERDQNEIQTKVCYKCGS
jgi:hypothetical protein